MKSFREIVKGQCSPIPVERIELVDLRETDIAEICCGVLFVHATWSGPSAAALSCLFSAIAEANPLDSFRILVVDSDDYEPSTLTAIVGELPQGWGETFWIKDGKVIAVSRNEHNADSLLSRITEFDCAK